MNLQAQECSYQSDTFYKSIMRVSFFPMKPANIVPSHKKGEVIYRRNLLTLFRRKVKRVVAEDEIRECGWETVYHTPVSDYVKSHSYLMLVDGVIHCRPKVVIESSIKDGGRTVYFNTNEEALDYIKTLKEKCKLCENNLL